MHIIRIVFLVSFCQVKNETRIKTFRLQEFRLEKTRIPIGDKKSSLVSGSIFVFRLAFLFGCIPHYIFSSEWDAENLSHWHFSSAKNGEYKARKNRNSHKLRHICIYPIFYKYGKNSIQAISTTQPTTITDTRKKWVTKKFMQMENGIVIIIPNMDSLSITRYAIHDTIQNNHTNASANAVFVRIRACVTFFRQHRNMLASKRTIECCRRCFA